MTSPKPLPTQERLRELFDYRKDGCLVCRMSWDTPLMPGTVLRGGNGRYAVVDIDGVQYRLHRLIFMWHHGWCPDEVDHENRHRDDNRIENLRDGTDGVNQGNRSTARNSPTGITGVTFSRHAGRYMAVRTRRGRRHFLGYHDSIDRAAEAIEEFEARG